LTPFISQVPKPLDTLTQLLDNEDSYRGLDNETETPGFTTQ